MCADIVVVPEVEVPTHGGSVAGTKQRLDVSCKTGGAPLSGHDGAPFPIDREDYSNFLLQLTVYPLVLSERSNQPNNQAEQDEGISTIVDDA